MRQKRGWINEVNVLLDHGADINARGGARDATALMWAAYHGHLELVKELLSRGADINARDNWEESALLYAMANEKIDVVKELLARGAKLPNPITFIHKTPARKLIEEFFNFKETLAKKDVKPFDVLREKVNEGNSCHVQYLLNNYQFDVTALKNLLKIAKYNFIKEPYNPKLIEEYKRIGQMLKAKTVFSRVSRSGRFGELPSEIIQEISNQIKL